MPQSDLDIVASIDAVPNILRVVCQVTGLGFAAVARVTESQWIALAVRDEIGFGLEPGGELDLATTICNEIRDSQCAVVIDHVSEHPVFRDHPTPKMYGFQSYISVPILLRNGQFFGTLCAIDPQPAAVSKPSTVKTFELFAELLALHLENRERVAASTVALLDERRAGEMREQFIAVLGHDLRNPLAAITAGTGLLSRMKLDPKAGTILQLMRESCKRMTDLTADILDFARGKMAGGVPLRAVEDDKLHAQLHQVVDELRTIHAERAIDADISITSTVFCDSARLAQLLSNLLGNALTHGDPNRPVRVEIRDGADHLVIKVSNFGRDIGQAELNSLFHPFARGGDGPRDGLGLGLFIAAEIARAHRGSLTANSRDGMITFLAQMPTVRAQAESEAAA